jgi:ribose-phosphate pyrophosphokinase
VPITAKLVANLITSAGADRMLMLDLHSQQLQGFFDIPVDHLYASPVIVKHIRSLDLQNLVVASPDVGGVKMAYAYAKLLDAGVAIVNKQRTSATEVEVLNLIGDVQDRDVVMVDDLTSTAGTLTSAARLLKKSGARRVFAAVSHCMLNELGNQRLDDSAIEQLICTDSIPLPANPSPKLKSLSVAGLLGDAILRIHNNQSVTSLFRI